METPATTIAQGLRKAFANFPARRRWQALIVFALMLFSALAEIVSIGAVLPFLAVVANPSSALGHPRLAALLSLFGVRNGSDAIVLMTTLFCVASVAAAVIRIVLNRVSQKFVFRLGYDLGVALYRRMLFQPYSFHVSINSSRIVSAINKVQQIVTGMMMPIMQSITSVIIALSIFTGLMLINAPVALAAALGFGSIYIGVSAATRGRLRRNAKIIAAAQTQRLKTVQEGLGGIRDVLIDHAQPLYVAKFARIDTELREAQAANSLFATSPRYVIESAGMVIIALIALTLSRKGGIANALPTLGALALGAQRLLPLLQQIYSGWTLINGNRYMFLDVVALLERPLPEDSRTRHRVKPMPFARDVAIEGVGFRYSDDGPLVVRDVNITIKKGSRVGFVGKTGSGKSTIMDLILGLLSPTEGSVRIDGKALDTTNIPAWQVQVAHVPQHIYLADATIIENIAFGVPRDKIDEARARSAAERADIASFIDEQPAGYDAIVGERGVRLSGGQRQRIGIARALYKRSTVLVFDEATSALDDVTEAAVIEAIERLGRDLTVLMIAHRVTTLRNCDVIYRLDRGKLVGQGRYEEIIKGAATPRQDETEQVAAAEQKL